MLNEFDLNYWKHAVSFKIIFLNKNNDRRYGCSFLHTMQDHTKNNIVNKNIKNIN